MHIVRLPNGEAIKLCHRPEWVDVFISPSILYTFGEIIYVSKHKKLREIHLLDLLHEQVHMEQQRKYNKYWWSFRYIFTKSFRLDQEAEAFAAEIKHTVTLEARRKLLNQAAQWLSGKEYNHCAKSFEHAKEIVFNKCSYKDFI